MFEEEFKKEVPEKEGFLEDPLFRNFYKDFRELYPFRGMMIDAKELSKLKEDYLKRYPGRLQEVEILFNLPELLFYTLKSLELSKRMRFPKPTPYRRLPRYEPSAEEQKRVSKELVASTEMQYLIANLLLNNIEDEDYLRKFWDIYKAIADQSRSSEIKVMSLKFKKGVIGQLGTHRIFKKLGYKLSFPHPKEDAWLGADFWVELRGKKIPLQVSYARDIENLTVLPVSRDKIEIEKQKEGLSSHQLEKLKRFFNQAKNLLWIESQKQAPPEKIPWEIKRKQITGIFALIPSGTETIQEKYPHGVFDPITAKPSPEILEEFKTKLEEIEKLL